MQSFVVLLETAHGHVPFSMAFIPDLLLGYWCGVEWAGARGQGAVAAGIKMTVLLLILGLPL